VRDYPRAGPYNKVKFNDFDWNELDVTVRGGVVTTTVNGKALTAKDVLASFQRIVSTRGRAKHLFERFSPWSSACLRPTTRRWCLGSNIPSAPSCRPGWHLGANAIRLAATGRDGPADGLSA